MISNIPRASWRPAARSMRLRQQIRLRQSQNPRFQSTSPTSNTQSAPGSSGALMGGLAGGAVALAVGYAWYHVSGARTVVNNVHSAKQYVDSALKKTTEKAPEPNQAIQWLRETVQSYTKMIPGASQYFDKAFEDMDKVAKQHEGEVEKIVTETYHELKDVTKAGFTMEAVTRAWDAVQKCFERVGNLASDAAEDILDNHPELKDKVGSNFSQLKHMGEQYGPAAKKQVDETWKQVQDILKGGFSADTLSKVQRLVQEKTEQMKKYGDQAWQKGIDEAKPFLDKQPKLKEFLDKNKQQLLQGNLGSLWTKLEEAAKSGNTESVELFIKEQVDSVRQKAGDNGGIEQVFSMLPGGKDIAPKLQELQELGQKHGKEAEKLLKSTIEDIKKVLEKKVDEGQKLKEKVEADVKK